jgi:hypothetical protein
LIGFVVGVAFSVYIGRPKQSHNSVSQLPANPS